MCVFYPQPCLTYVHNYNVYFICTFSCVYFTLNHVYVHNNNLIYLYICIYFVHFNLCILPLTLEYIQLFIPTLTPTQGIFYPYLESLKLIANLKKAFFMFWLQNNYSLQYI